MKAIPFTKNMIKMAEHQEQYNTLPCHKSNCENGVVTVCWKLSWKERFKLLITGKLWHQILTFHDSLQPILLSTKRPEIIDE